MSEPVIVKERSKDQEGGKYTQDVMTSRHHLTADEPESFGSADLGPTPLNISARRWARARQSLCACILSAKAGRLIIWPVRLAIQKPPLAISRPKMSSPALSRLRTT